MSISQVTVIIPTYNCAQYLSEAIESALNQTVPCEIIVVDDGSTDNTKEIVTKYLGRITYAYKDNEGRAALSRNFGIIRSTTEYIVTLDSDDILLPDFIEKTYNSITENNADIVNVDAVAFNTEGGEEILHSSKFSDSLFQANVALQCALIKKSFWEKLEGQESSMPYNGWEDWSFWIKSYRAGAIQNVINEPLYRYRVHPQSATYLEVIPHMEAMTSWMKEKGYQ